MIFLILAKNDSIEMDSILIRIISQNKKIIRDVIEILWIKKQ